MHASQQQQKGTQQKWQWLDRLEILTCATSSIVFFSSSSLWFPSFPSNRRENQINNRTNDWNVLTAFPAKINTKNRRTVLICVAVMWQKTIKIHPHVFIFWFVVGCFFYCGVSSIFFLHSRNGSCLGEKNSTLESAWCLLVNHWALLLLLIRLMPLMVMLSQSRSYPIAIHSRYHAAGALMPPFMCTIMSQKTTICEWKKKTSSKTTMEMIVFFRCVCVKGSKSHELR